MFINEHIISPPKETTTMYVNVELNYYTNPCECGPLFNFAQIQHIFVFKNIIS